MSSVEPIATGIGAPAARSRSSVLSALVIALLVAVVVSATSGYVVILKNGQRIRAREPMTVQDKQVLIVLSTGTLTTIPIDRVDFVATERYNKLGLGNALTIDALDRVDQPRPTATPRRPLGSLTTLSADTTKSILGSVETPTPTPTPGIQLHNYPYPESKVDEAFKQMFEEHRMYLYRTSVGTHRSYYMVQAVTDSDREVFNALQAVASSYAVISTRYPEMAPEAVELQMVTTAGKPAGTFRISPEMASTLSSGKISPEAFYVKHVIF